MSVQTENNVDVANKKYIKQPRGIFNNRKLQPGSYILVHSSPVQMDVYSSVAYSFLFIYLCV